MKAPPKTFSFSMICLLVLSFLAAGCFNLNVNVPDLDGKGGGEKPDQQRSAPSQLPSGGSGSWRNIATAAAGQAFLAAENGVLFYAYDSLAHPDWPVDLAVRLQSADDLKGIRDVTVAFLDGQELIGTARTNASGLAMMRWTPPATGNYQFTAKIVEVPTGAAKAMLDVTPAPLLVAVRKKSASFVVIDLDHTVVDSSFFRVLIGGAKPMADSVEVAGRIAGRYSIIYLTHRPALLTRKSKMWLSQHGYPPGPLLVSELKEVFGDSGKFKTAKLMAVRKSFPNTTIGIGDKLSDAQAYVDNGLTAHLIPHYKNKPKDMRKMAQNIRQLRGRGRLHVVDGWREIEAGIFEGHSFPPATFVGRLHRRADQLEAEERARKRDEKRDDDDDD